MSTSSKIGKNDVDETIAKQEEVNVLKSDFTEHEKHGVNNNFLINSDFRNPVNQRGLSSYTDSSGAYTIDKWFMQYSGITVTPVSGGLKVEVGSNGSGIAQRIEAKSLFGKKVTGSLKISNGDIYTFTCQLPNEGTTAFETYANVAFDDGFFGLTSRYGVADAIALFIDIKPNSSLIIEWVKLEIGNHATPYVPRLYAEEWLLCQRYYKRVRVEKNPYAINGNNVYVRHLLDAENMRANPTIKVLSSSLLYEAYDYDNFVGSIVNTSGSIVTMQYTKENHGRTDLSKLCDSVYFELDSEL